MRRLRLDRTTVFTLIAAATLLVAYAATVALSNRYYVVAAPASSVYSASPNGFKVFYTYLSELGYDPKAVQSFDDLPRGTTIVSAGPYDNKPTEADANALARWVRHGGRLVAIGPDAAQLLDPMGFGGSPNTAQTTDTLKPLFPGAYAVGVGKIQPGLDRLLLDASAWVAHYKDFGGQVLVSRKVGDGEVVWLAGPYALSNAGIAENDNALLALQLATAGGRPVYFDEYHHGFVRRSGYWDRLAAGGRSAVLLLGGALAIALVAWSRRIGPAIPEVAEPEARSGTYVGQLAQLYRKAGARSDALLSLEEGLTRSLVRRHGTLDVGLRHHADARAALDASRALREGPGVIGEDTFVKTARGLARARREVEGRG